jgi:hypothetical protein
MLPGHAQPALRKIANAWAWVHRSWAMMAPIAWSMAAREAMV